VDNDADQPDPGVPLAADGWGERLWQSVTRAYTLDPTEICLLEQACLAADRLEMLDAMLTEPGREWIVPGRYSGMVVMTPILKEIREHQRRLSSLIAQMALPDTSDSGVVLPDDVLVLPQRKTGRVGGA
jgi:hypothetical protein